MLLHFNSPSCPKPFWLFRLEDWVSLHVYPVGWLGRNMTTQAVFLVIRRDLLIRCIRFEKCPSPSITPQRSVGVPILVVLDHHEPHFCSSGPVCVPGCHLRVISRKDLFH